MSMGWMSFIEDDEHLEISSAAKRKRFITMCKGKVEPQSWEMPPKSSIPKSKIVARRKISNLSSYHVKSIGKY